MASMSTSAEIEPAIATASTPSIIVTRQQTRFHIIEYDASKEIDINNLSIVIAAGNNNDVPAGSKVKGKSRARSEGHEILTNAQLRLKTGVHYSLIGRNGTGKSTILRALAEKLIPGIPLPTRIAILQQTAEGDNQDSRLQQITADRSVLEQVVHGDPYRNEVEHELNGSFNTFDDLKRSPSHLT